jgi:NADH-quinone oxidoreductase subunit J
VIKIFISNKNKIKNIMFFNILSTVIILTSILLLFVKNTVHSVFFLILVFCGISILTCMLKVSFIGIIFIIVYVGAIAVLFLFVVMMLNIRYMELKENFMRYLPIAFSIIFIFLLQIFYFFKINYIAGPLAIVENDWLTVSNLEVNIKSIGYLLYTHYSLAFILASCVLLLAMVGTIVLTLNQNFKLRRQNILKQVNRTLHKSISIKN